MPRQPAAHMKRGARRSLWAALVPPVLPALLMPPMPLLLMLMPLLLLYGTAAHSATERAAQGALTGTSALGAGVPPPPGLYDANLCVSVAGGSANCGPVVVDLGAAGQVLVQINDVSYRLQTVGDQLGVSLFHGTMQLDGFFARHKWSASTLTFSDPEKGTRYELQVGTRRFAPPQPAPQ